MHHQHSFQNLLEHIYFYCLDDIERITFELNSYHLNGHYSKSDSFFLRKLTKSISQIHDSKDINNTLMVASTVLIHEYGRNSNGEYCPITIKENLGELALRLYDNYNSPTNITRTRHRPDNPVTRNELIRFTSLIAPNLVKLAIKNYPVRPEMTVFEQLKQRFGSINSDIDYFVGIQHLFGSTAKLIETICESSIDNKNVFVLGKPYSTNYAAMWYMKESGNYNVHNGSYSYSGISDYHLVADLHIEELLSKVVLSF